MYYYGSEGLHAQAEIYEKEFPAYVPFEHMFREYSMVAFTDASYAPAATNEVSVGGFIVTLAGAPVCWRCGKQELKSMSTTEAELQAAREGFTGTLSVRALLGELDMVDWLVWLAIDNKPCVQLLQSNQPTSWRTRHLKIRADTLMQLMQLGLLHLVHISGDIEIADILTKALSSTRVILLRTMCGVLNLAQAEHRGKAAKVLAETMKKPQRPETTAPVADESVLEDYKAVDKEFALSDFPFLASAVLDPHGDDDDLIWISDDEYETEEIHLNMFSSDLNDGEQPNQAGSSSDMPMQSPELIPNQPFSPPASEINSQWHRGLSSMPL